MASSVMRMHRTERRTFFLDRFLLSLKGFGAAPESRECPIDQDGLRDSRQDTIVRAFLSAHLLTGSAELAEEAVSEAVERWNPCGETEDVLFLGALRAAVRNRAGYESRQPDCAGAFRLPEELRAVLSLDPQVRCCFVLRLLAGLSRQDCARLLHVTAREVDRSTCAALKNLADKIPHSENSPPHTTKE